MKAVKSKIRAPKKADRISSAKDVIGESHIALFHDDFRLCEENLYTLFELKNEKESIVKLDMHSGEIYLFKEGSPEKIDYSLFSTLQKKGGKGAGKYKHLNEKNWKSLVDKTRLLEIADYHNPQPVLRAYPTDVTPPDFEAYYIKLYEGESEKCVYLRNVGEDNWRVFYAESFGIPLGFEAYSLSEYVLKDILTGSDRRSDKGQLDCFDRLIGIDEIQYLSAFMPNVHESKRQKGLALAGDDEGKVIVNAYYWKKSKSVPCADEDYILSLFSSLKEIAVNSVELEFEDEEEESVDLDEILDEIAKGVAAPEPEQEVSEQEAEPEEACGVEEGGEEIETEQQLQEQSEQSETEQIVSPGQAELPPEETEPEEEQKPRQGKPEKKKKRFSLFGKKKKQPENEEKKEADIIPEQAEALPEGEQLPEAAEKESPQTEEAEPFEAEIISLPLEREEEMPDTETETEEPEVEEVFEPQIEPEAEQEAQAKEEEEKTEDEVLEEESKLTLEQIPTDFVSLADELLGEKPKPELTEEAPEQEQIPSEVVEEEFKLEFEPEPKESVIDEAEPESEEDGEQAQTEEEAEQKEQSEESAEAEQSAAELPESDISAAEPEGEAEQKEAEPKPEKAPEKGKRSRKELNNTAFFELSSLVGAYSVAGRKKSKLKSEIINTLPFSPLIVPITAAEYDNPELVYVSKQCYKLCGEKIIPFTMMSDKEALLPTEENEGLRKGVMVQTVVNMGKAYIPVFSDFKSAAQIFGANEKFGVFTLKNLLTHISSSETIQGITINPGTVNLKLGENDFEHKK